MKKELKIASIISVYTIAILAAAAVFFIFVWRLCYQYIFLPNQYDTGFMLEAGSQQYQAYHQALTIMNSILITTAVISIICSCFLWYRLGRWMVRKQPDLYLFATVLIGQLPWFIVLIFFLFFFEKTSELILTVGGSGILMLLNIAFICWGAKIEKKV